MKTETFTTEQNDREPVTLADLSRAVRNEYREALADLQHLNQGR